MTIFDTLLQRIISLSGEKGTSVTVMPGKGSGPYESGICSYFIGGGMELDQGCNTELLPSIERGNIEAVYRLAWSFANSASMIESGVHFFLSRETATAWRDRHPNAVYHDLEITRLTEEMAQREIARLDASQAL